MLSLLIFATWLTIADFFDPAAIDYCKLKCRNGAISSGCPKTICYKHKDKEEVAIEAIATFRQETLDLHNKLRNKIAKGEEEVTNGYPSSSDMHVLNYDLELEYLARCYIMGDFVSGHDKCRMTSSCNFKHDPGQNLYGQQSNSDTLKTVESGIMSWYDELRAIPSNERHVLVNNFTGNNAWAHFTQLIWGPATRIGCVRVWCPKNTDDVYKYVLACNYASTYKMCAGNVIGQPVYTIGRPCSQCGDEQCNNNNQTGGKYDALCGKSEQVSTDPPKEPKHNRPDWMNGLANDVTSNGLFTVLAVIVVIRIC